MIRLAWIDWSRGSADQSDRNSARSFFTLANFILDRLTFPELLDGRPFHLGVMKEQIAPFTFDEPKTLLGQYLLNLTVWHFWTLRKLWKHGTAGISSGDAI
jgi:hypothetical protein